MELVDRMLRGEPAALARLMTMVENRSASVPAIMREINSYLGRAYRVGITGPPGAGKSTLADRLTALLRKRGETVGIVAIDPTSPFSGGALLGDRIRMQQHYLDSGVFIRSMGTRGSHGGLARATRDVMKLLDASGKDWVIVETVGVGQTELDVMEATDTTLVVLVPESGDSVQTMKAGLLEIADIFAVNKADRAGADRVQAELEMMLHIAPQRDSWQIPVLRTQAENGVGMEELLQAIDKHRDSLRKSEQLERRREHFRRQELVDIIEEQIRIRLVARLTDDPKLKLYAEDVLSGTLDPYTAAQEILSNEQLIASILGQDGQKVRGRGA